MCSSDLSGFVGLGEPGRLAGEAEFEEVDAVAHPDQALAQLEGGDGPERGGHEGLDPRQQLLQGRDLVGAITHPGSIYKSV